MEQVTGRDVIDCNQAQAVPAIPVNDGVTAVPVESEQINDPVSSTSDAVQALLTQAEVSSADPEVKQSLVNLGVAYNKARAENNELGIEMTGQKLEELLEQKGLEPKTRKALTQAKEVLGSTADVSTGQTAGESKTPWQELREIHNNVARGLVETGQSVQQARDNATIYMNYLLRRTERLKAEGQNTSVGKLHKMQVVPGKQGDQGESSFNQALPMELQKDFLEGLSGEQRTNLEADYNRWGETLDILTGKKEAYSDGSALDVSKPITILSKTPAALGLAGAKEDLPVVILKSTLAKKALGPESREAHSHGLTPEELAQIPAALVDPLIVMHPTSNSKNVTPDSLVVVTGIIDSKGRPVLVPLQLSVKKTSLEVNLASSVYGKEGIQHLLETGRREGKLRYINESALPNSLQGSLGHMGSAGDMQSSKELISEQRISRRSDLVKRWLSDDTYYQTAWHGSPHRFEKFDLGSVGTGEGAQSHGWGLYFAQDKKSAMNYRPGPQQDADLMIGSEDSLAVYERLSQQANLSKGPAREKLYNRLALIEDLMITWDISETLRDNEGNPELPWFQKDIAPKVSTTKGSMTEADIPNNDVLLDEQLPMTAQPEGVQKAVKRLLTELGRPINGNTTGQEFYSLLAQKLGPEGASRRLNELGVKGITYDGERDGRSFVVFDDKAIQVIERYNQRAESDRRGSIEFTEDGRSIVTLFEKADGSTFIHETSHLMLNDLINDGLSAESSSRTKALMNQAVEYLGIGNLDLTSRQNFTAEERKQFRAAHEKFAESFEEYLREGVAPTRGLMEIFRRLKEELLRIYGDVRAAGVKPSPEIRKLFDELLSGKRTETVKMKTERAVTPAMAPTQKKAPKAKRFDISKAYADGKSEHGTVWRGLENNPDAAVELLLQQREGEVVGAMTDPDLGAIDFVTGLPGDPAKSYKGGFGFAHILEKHGEKAARNVPEIIRKGTRERVFDAYVINSPLGRVMLQTQWSHQPKNWVVTAYEPGVQTKSNTKKDPRSVRDVQADRRTGEPSSSPDGGLSKRTIPPTITEGNTEGIDFSTTGTVTQPSRDLWGGAPDLWSKPKQNRKAKQKIRGEELLESLGLERSTEGATDEPTPDLAAMVRRGTVHFDESKLAPDDGKARPQQSLTRLRDVISTLGNITPVRSGSRFKGSVLGYYTLDTGVARLRHKGDIQTGYRG